MFAAFRSSVQWGVRLDANWVVRRDARTVVSLRDQRDVQTDARSFVPQASAAEMPAAAE